MTILTLVVLILLVLAAVLFGLAAKNIGAPTYNLLAAGACCATLAAIIYIFVH